MKILAFSPFESDAFGGNVVTLNRIRRGLSARGHRFEIVRVSREFHGNPDVLLFYHAYKTGRFLLDLDGFPSVVVLSGTDLNRDFEDPARRPILEQVLRRADRLVTYNSSLYERIRTVLPEVLGKLHVIPKGVELGQDPFDLRAAAGVGERETLFFLPGGIRPVKNNLFAIEMLSDVPNVRLVLAGPILDPEYGEKVRRRIAQAPWARHLERIPHSAMGSAHGAADVVLNTSRSEGISNVLMEAMAAGRAVLASDIPGNRDLIEDGKTGVLYRETEFRETARRLAFDREWRETLGRVAQERAKREFSVDREIDSYEKVFNALGRREASSPDRPRS